MEGPMCSASAIVPQMRVGRAYLISFSSAHGQGAAQAFCTPDRRRSVIVVQVRARRARVVSSISFSVAYRQGTAQAFCTPRRRRRAAHGNRVMVALV